MVKVVKARGGSGFAICPPRAECSPKPTPARSSAKELNLDINDPEARSSDLDHRAGYEWRLRPTADDLDNPPPALDLFGLQFFPLVLDQVEFEDDGVRKVDLIGRLQLPIENGGEQTDLGNAVRLTFSGSGTSLTLSAAAIEPPALDDPPIDDSPIGAPALDWPLALSSGEVTDAPRLRCAAIAVGEGGAALTVDQVQLRFFLFQVEWAVTLPSIRFPNPLTPPFTLPQVSSQEALAPETIVADAGHAESPPPGRAHAECQARRPAGQRRPAGSGRATSALHLRGRQRRGYPRPLQRRHAARSDGHPGHGISWGPQGLTVSQTDPDLLGRARDQADRGLPRQQRNHDRGVDQAEQRRAGQPRPDRHPFQGPRQPQCQAAAGWLGE